MKKKSFMTSELGRFSNMFTKRDNIRDVSACCYVHENPLKWAYLKKQKKKILLLIDQYR